MAKKNSIVLEIDAIVNGEKAVGNLSVNMEQLGKVTKAARSSMESITWAAVAKGADSVQRTVQSLTGAMTQLTDAYAIQEQAERQLETAMRNTMGASLDQIQSVKDLCGAQQQLGVIGDEVQLQGAQKMAMYLKEADTLKTLIPLINDMAASQAGLNVTGSDCEQSAAALGKAMNGQTTTLQRMGFVFSDAQKEVMKYGTEAEKAAVLTEVVGSKVNGMNEALAQTASGRMKQINNALGDMKERLGRVASSIMPVMQGLAATSTAVTGVIRLTAGVKACTASLRAWAVSANAAKTAMRGLLVSTGVGAAIAALGFIIDKVILSTDKAADSAEEHTRQLEAERRAYTDTGDAAGRYAQQELRKADQLIAVITDETKSREKRVAAVRDLQAAYPGYFSQLNAEKLNVETLAGCYDRLKDSIIKASRARAAQDRMDENMAILLDLEQAEEGARQAVTAAYQKQVQKSNARSNAQQAYNNAVKQDAATDNITDPYNGEGATASQKALASLNKAKLEENQAASEHTNALAYLQSILDKKKQIIEANDKLAGFVEEGGNYRLGTPETPTPTPTPAPTTDTTDETDKWHEEITCLQDIIDNISALEKKRATASKEDVAGLNEQIESLRGMRKEWEELRPAVEEGTPEPVDLTPMLEGMTQAAKQFGAALGETQPKVNEHATTLSEINGNIDIYIKLLQGATVEEAASINQSITLWQKKADAIKNAGKETKVTFDNFRGAWSGVKGVTSAVTQLTEKLESDASTWDKVAASVDMAIGVYDGIAAVVKLIQTLTAATQTQTAVTEVDTVAKQENAIASATSATASKAQAVAATSSVPALEAEATGNVLDASAKTYNANSWVPFVGVALAAAMVGVMIAQMASLPKYAKGGIAYGPTAGIFGEYPGAGTNPEVVAPLDTLRDLLQPQGGDIGEVRFRIEGSDLVGILDRRNRKIHRTNG